MYNLLFCHYDDEVDGDIDEQKTSEVKREDINPNNLPMPFVRDKKGNLVRAKPGSKEAGYRHDKTLGKLVKL